MIPLFGDLPASAVATMLDYQVDYLLPKLGFSTDDRKAHHEAMFARLYQQLPPQTTRLSLAKVKLLLKKKLQLAPAAALLAADYKGPAQYAEQFNVLAGWGITAALSLILQDAQHQPKIDHALSAIRLMGSERDRLLSRILFERSTVSAVLNSIRTAIPAAAPTEIANRLDPIKVLLEAFVHDRKPITRERETGHYRGEYTTVVSTVAVIDRNDGDTGDMFTYQVTERIQGATEHATPDNASARMLVDSPDIKILKQHRVYTVRHHQTRIEMAAVTRRRMALPCQYGSLTAYEVETLMRAGLRSLEPKRPPDWKPRLLVLLSLITWRTPSELYELINPRFKIKPAAQNLNVIGEDVLLVFNAQLKPMLVGDLEREVLERESSRPLSLALPKVVAEILIGFLYEQEDMFKDDAPIHTVIKDALPKGHRPIALNRLASVLRDQLVRTGVDGALIAWILGETPQNVPALYYLSIDQPRVETVYRQAIDHIMGKPQTWPTSQIHIIGSSLRPRQEKVRTFFSAAQQELQSMSGGSFEDQIIFHNRYVVLVCVALMLATGHRPVRKPFERITDFDLPGRRLFISDKEFHVNSAGRFVPLADIALKQFEAYRRHLQALQLKAINYGQNVATAVDGALDGSLPLFFHIDHHDDQTLVTQTLRPKWLAEELADIWPLPLNWGRHVQRSLLAGTPTELADAFMGHAGPSADPFCSASGFSMDDLARLRSLLDDNLNALGACVFEGLVR